MTDQTEFKFRRWYRVRRPGDLWGQKRKRGEPLAPDAEIVVATSHEEARAIVEEHGETVLEVEIDTHPSASGIPSVEDYEGQI